MPSSTNASAQHEQPPGWDISAACLSLQHLTSQEPAHLVSALPAPAVQLLAKHRCCCEPLPLPFPFLLLLLLPLRLEGVSVRRCQCTRASVRFSELPAYVRVWGCGRPWAPRAARVDRCAPSHKIELTLGHYNVIPRSADPGAADQAAIDELSQVKTPRRLILHGTAERDGLAERRTRPGLE